MIDAPVNFVLRLNRKLVEPEIICLSREIRQRKYLE
jgi:hypothetical protein